MTNDSIKLPPNWFWVKLGDVALSINPGFPSGRHNQSQIGVPHLRPMNISSDGELNLSLVKYVEVEEYQKLQKEDILFNNTNSPELLGKTTVINLDSNFAYSNHMTRVRVDPQNTNPYYAAKYLHLLFWKGYFKLNCRNHVNQSSISKSFLSSILIPLPPLPEQKKIVEKIEELFSGLDSGVASLKKAKEQLRLYRQSVLAYAFSGKLSGNVKGETKNGELPEGWKWVKLSEVIKVGSGKGLNSDKMSSHGEYSVYGGNGISGYHDEYLFEDSKLIIGRVGAKCGVMHITKPKSWVTDNALIVDFHSNNVNMKFLYHCLGYHNLNKLSVSTAQPVISGAKIYPYEILLPPLDQQTQIVEEIEKRFSEADNLEKAIDESLTKAELLRQSILKQAFEGRLVQ